MPLLFPKKYFGELSKLKTRRVFVGERAYVAEILESSKKHPLLKGKIARFRKFESPRTQQPEKAIFYQNKIARMLFPKNFPEIIEVRERHENEIEMGSIVISNKIEFDNKSRKVAELMSDGDYRLGTYSARIATPEFKAHQKRVDEIAAPIKRKLKTYGIEVNLNPLNVWFDVKGRPIFFDIIEVHPSILISKINQTRNSSIEKPKLQNYLTRLNATLKGYKPDRSDGY